MQKNQSDVEKTSEIMRLTIRAMEKHHVLPTPENYQVWYMHLSGAKAKLSETINSLIAKSPALTEEQSKKLYDDFCGNDYEIESITNIHNELVSLVEELMGFVSKNLIDNQKTTHHLGAMSQKLSNYSSTKDAHHLILEVISETRMAVSHNELLFDQLDSTLLEVDKLKRELQESRKEAMNDSLTGLANRKSFDELIDSLTREVDKSPEQQLSIIFSDIDLFKNINDQEGHLVGDQVIKIVANTLNSSLKGRDLVARYGGEEFAVLLLNTCLEDAKKIAEDIRQAMESKRIKRKDTNTEIGKITLSLGVALYVAGEGVENFMRRADEALYKAKRGGRNRVIG